MQTIKAKRYKAKYWGLDSYWEVSLQCNDEDQLYMDIGIVRCDYSGAVIDTMPLGTHGPVEDERIVGLKRPRKDLQNYLFREFHNMGWDYDRKAFARKYRWDLELSREKELQATRPDWDEIEGDWRKWYLEQPWLQDDDITFEEWLARKYVWHSYDVGWLVELAQEQHPDETRLHELLRGCTSCRKENPYYISFVERPKRFHFAELGENAVATPIRSPALGDLIIYVDKRNKDRVVGVWFHEQDFAALEEKRRRQQARRR